MIWRPQFSYPPTPKGFEDETFSYTFDKSNTPLLDNTVVSILAGGYLNDILLPLQSDCEMIVRGLSVYSIGAVGSAGTKPSELWMKLKTPNGDYLSTTYVPICNWLTGQGGPVMGRKCIPLEPEVPCPAGGVWTAYLFNGLAVTLGPPVFTFFGVKRRPCGQAA